VLNGDNWILFALAGPSLDAGQYAQPVKETNRRSLQFAGR
jgi:hypothetical protein